MTRLAAGGATLLALVVLFEIVIPIAVGPVAHGYGTRLGWSSVRRRLRLPVPVSVAPAEKRVVSQVFHANGTVASEAVEVPIVGVGRVLAVLVQPGQRVHKGDPLAEIDPRAAKVRSDTAGLQVDSARSQLGRVQVGSPLQLNREQAGVDAIDAASLHRMMALTEKQLEVREDLYRQSIVSKEQYLNTKRTLEGNERVLRDAELDLAIASAGKSGSEQEAQAAVQQAAAQWREALAELEEMEVTAPADGVVHQVLVHTGEFNPAPGTTGFVLEVGAWFEAYFDPAAQGYLETGAAIEVTLATGGAPMSGRLARVDPILEYTAGKPDVGRPIPPGPQQGPVWPGTLRARVELAPEDSARLVAGVSGVAGITARRDAVAVPVAAMRSMSAGRGRLLVVDGATWQGRDARYGVTDGRWIEVTAGASAGDQVIVAGAQVLEPGDRVKPLPAAPN